jgi:hypothetical protein
MKTQFASLLPGALAATALVLGCGGPGAEDQAGGDVRTVAVSTLPKLAEPLQQPLDAGRLTISPPAGWKTASRDSRFLVRFQEDPHDSYPSIIVKVEDQTGPIRNVTRQTVHDFAGQVAAEFRKGKAQRTVIEPFQVGSFVGVNYERRGRAKHDYKEITVERLILETVVDGRRYSIDLRTRDQDLAKYRGHAFAVAAGMNFDTGVTAADAPAEPRAEPAPTEEPPEEPAETQPPLELQEEL